MKRMIFATPAAANEFEDSLRALARDQLAAIAAINPGRCSTNRSRNASKSKTPPSVTGNIFNRLPKCKRAVSNTHGCSIAETQTYASGASVFA